MTKIFDLSMQYKINLVKINPKSRYFFIKFSTLKFEHIFNHIAERNYEFAPKIRVYRLISFLKKLISRNQVDFSFELYPFDTALVCPTFSFLSITALRSKSGTLCNGKLCISFFGYPCPLCYLALSGLLLILMVLTMLQ